MFTLGLDQAKRVAGQIGVNGASAATGAAMGLEAMGQAWAALVEAHPRALLRDALVCLHRLAMTLGLGSVLGAEIRLLGGPFRPMRAGRVAARWRTHRVVLGALGALWLTGGGLAALATGLDPAVAGATLAVKLATVAGLSLTALAMGAVALPLLGRHPGASPAALGLGAKLLLALLGGLSSGGWLSALALGAAGTLRDAPVAVLAPLVAGLHAGAVAVALAGALALHLVGPRALRGPVPVRLT